MSTTTGRRPDSGFRQAVFALLGDGFRPYRRRFPVIAGQRPQVGTSHVPRRIPSAVATGIRRSPKHHAVAGSALTFVFVGRETGAVSASDRPCLPSPLPPIGVGSRNAGRDMLLKITEHGGIFAGQTTVNRRPVRVCPAARCAPRRSAIRWCLPASSPGGGLPPADCARYCAPAGRPGGSVPCRSAPGSDPGP